MIRPPPRIYLRIGPAPRWSQVYSRIHHTVEKDPVLKQAYTKKRNNMRTSPNNTRKNIREGEISDHFFRELQIEFLIHELKDPIAVIEAGARILLEKKEKFGPLASRQEKTLRRILRSALKSRSMLNNLLEIGRAEANRFVPGPFFPTKTIYASLLESIETMGGEFFEEGIEQKTEGEVIVSLAEAGILFHTAAGVEEIEIIQDESSFSQVVGNLIKNALRFRKEKLEIKVSLAGDKLGIEISDDGPGIKPENHDLIFQRYAQVDAEATLARKGYGLGLAGARILARRLGGEIVVQSEAGKGATFRFTVPAKMETKNKR